MKAAGLMGFMTLISRVIGMIRDVVSAQAFGTTWQWDAFLYAFMIPNFFRRLVGEGALSSVFIPVYNEIYQTQGKEEAFRFSKSLLSILETSCLVIIAVFLIGIQFFLQIKGLPPRALLIADLLRFLLPYMALMSSYALFMGVLNSHKEFLTSSFGPVIMNVGWIAGIILITTYGPRDLVLQLRWQSLVTVASGIGQVFFQVPALKRIGFHFRWSWNPHHPGIQKCKKLIMPVLIGFSVMQINLVVDSAFAYWAGPGANSALWYGNRLMQFPLGVFAIAISSALLPTISQQFAAGRPDIAKKNLSFSMRAVCLIVLPCAAGLIVLATPIVRFLFERGQFDAESTRRTAAVLWCYSVGLLGYAGQKVIISGFYALQNTRTPMKVSIAALLVNVFFNATLLRPMGEAGLAMATSISGIFNFVALIVIFHRRVSPLPIKEIMTSFLRILMATAAMAVTAVFCYHILAGRLPGVSASVQALRVFGAITLATLSYPVYCFLFRVPELQEALAFFGNRKKTA